MSFKCTLFSIQYKYFNDWNSIGLEMRLHKQEHTHTKAYEQCLESDGHRHPLPCPLLLIFNFVLTNAVDEWWQERRRSREEVYIAQIQRSRKHRQCGLTRSQKLLSLPIDFFSTIWDNSSPTTD